MESWCFDSLDSGYVSSESLSQSGSIIRTKDELNCWDFKVASSYDHTILGHTQQSMENHGFSEGGLSEMMRKQFPVGDIGSSSMVISNLVSREEESSSKVSSSVVDSSSRETSQIDLKLGGFSDNIKCSPSRIAPCSSESSTRVKRVRGTSFGSQIVYCQVHGCSKDLSSAKDYHKRHKVCDAHSKTSKVVVNGVEQRFCQQCSRFHLLGEFDDGKRSCRKRLAGHNQRRRKPQVSYNSRAGRYFSYAGSVGSKFHGTTLPAASYNFQETLPGSASHPAKYETNGWNAHVKTEDQIDFSQKPSNIFSNGQFWTPSYSSINSISDNKSQSVLGSEDVTPFNIASTAQGLPGISESGCALSLLSYQSQNSPNTNPHYNVTEVSEKLIGVSSWGLTNGNQNTFSNNSFGNEFHQGSDFVNANNRFSCEDGTTVNLLQLSSQLHRVENQKQNATGKHEAERF